MLKDLIVCLQEAISYYIYRKPWIPKHASGCLIDIPCQCPHPGKEPQCEDCPHLEACLSRVKLHQTKTSPPPCSWFPFKWTDNI